jgi:3-hydroxyacyl-[acyl-carrier-protein] dehydratase
VESLSLPLDYSAIARILPHRYPFLLVDRITELEPDKRIVGIKNVSFNEQYLSQQPGEPPAVPPTILTECVAQVGAILMLSKAENRGKLVLFSGIKRVRFRKAVHAGDVVVIEARVKRMRRKMGIFEGVARVNGEVVVEGTMSCVIGDASDAFDE